MSDDVDDLRNSRAIFKRRLATITARFTAAAAILHRDSTGRDGDDD
jgi:hypothetical protein